jgi:hypothetical protein
MHPAAGRFMPHKVVLSYGRGSTGRAIAPPSAPTPQLNEVRRANGSSLPLRGEHAAGAGAPPRKSRRPLPVVRSFFAAFNVTDGSGESQLLEWAI